MLSLHSLEHIHCISTCTTTHTHLHTHTVAPPQCVMGLVSASEVDLLDTPQMDYLYSVQLKSLSVSLKAKSRMNQ